MNLEGMGLKPRRALLRAADLITKLRVPCLVLLCFRSIRTPNLMADRP